MEGRHGNRSRVVIELFAQARFQTSIHAFEVLTPLNPDYMQLINTLDVPSMLIVGDVGSVVTLEIAAELARLNKRLEVVQIEGQVMRFLMISPSVFRPSSKPFCAQSWKCLKEGWKANIHNGTALIKFAQKIFFQEDTVIYDLG